MKAAVLATAFALLSSSLPARAETITFASWNIANLHHQTGVSLRPGSVARRDIDYERLAAIGAELQADVVALQEVGSPAALLRVFPADKYHLVVSDLYQAGDENLPPEQRDIFTALAISKERFPEAPAVESVRSLALDHISFDRRTSSFQVRPTRSGILFEFNLNGRPVSFLGVHLKSFCHDFPLDVIEDQNFFNGKAFDSRFDCRTLKAQLAVLESWIEAKQASGRSVVIAGDFNRRMNVVYRNPTRHEDFWANLNDGQPDRLELAKGPEEEDKVCWPKHASRHLENIDFIVADKKLISTFRNVSFKKVGLGFDDHPDYTADNRQLLSDHCPVIMTMSD